MAPETVSSALLGAPSSHLTRISFVFVHFFRLVTNCQTLSRKAILNYLATIFGCHAIVSTHCRHLLSFFGLLAWKKTNALCIQNKQRETKEKREITQRERESITKEEEEQKALACAWESVHLYGGGKCWLPHRSDSLLFGLFHRTLD